MGGILNSWSSAGTQIRPTAGLLGSRKRESAVNVFAQGFEMTGTPSFVSSPSSPCYAMSGFGRGDSEVTLKHLREYLLNNNLGIQEDLKEFLAELFDILENNPADKWVAHLRQFLEDWEATAELCLDEDAIAELHEAGESIRRGETIRWIPPTDM